MAYYEFYCVYVLKSTKKNAFYVGSTPDPRRRLRQHNGALSSGAKRTKNDNLRPWQIVLLVHGFMTNISALQFETALNKPHLTRYLSEQEKRESGVGKGRSRSLRQHVKVAKKLMASSYFSRLCLEMKEFDYPEEGGENGEAEESLGPLEEHLGKYMVPHASQDEEKVAVAAADGAGCKCSVCRSEYHVTAINCEESAQPSTVRCLHCGAVSHTVCLARELLSQEYSQTGLRSLLPVKGECGICRSEIVWRDLIRSKVRQALLGR